MKTRDEKLCTVGCVLYVPLHTITVTFCHRLFALEASWPLKPKEVFGLANSLVHIPLSPPRQNITLQKANTDFDKAIKEQKK